MKRTFLLVAALTMSLTTLHAASFQEGLKAFQNGDYETALKEWRAAAKQENYHAQYNLGYMHAKGIGVPRNTQRAYMWFQLSAENGFDDAKKARDKITKGMSEEELNKAMAHAVICEISKFSSVEDCG